MRRSSTAFLLLSLCSAPLGGQATVVEGRLAVEMDLGRALDAANRPH